MRAVKYSYREGLSLMDVDHPETRENTVLVELKASGLCASDIHYMDGRFRYSIEPITPGHEGSGVVKEVGDGVTDISVGDRVIIDYVKGCGVCRYCGLGYENRCREAIFYGFDEDGTFQEYILVNKDNVVRLPENIDYEVGAIIGCAVITPYHAIKEVGGVEDKDIAVIGLGGVGIHGVLLSRILGANKIVGVDIDNMKENIALKYGADYFINPHKEDLIKFIEEELGGVDIAFEFVGTIETIDYTLRATRKGGISLIAGLLGERVQVDVGEMIAGEKRIIFIEDHTHRELEELVDLINRENIDLSESISHRFMLRDIDKAINLFRERRETFNRIVLKME
jgi:propanol-preferring alcohol dehydrogenase